LIAAGATRGPLKPLAPYEGLAYGAHPCFGWAAAPGALAYHFILRDGTSSTSPIFYESDVKTARFVYPESAPALVPGKIYSWRVSVPGVMEPKLGPAARFFILEGDDAGQVRRALEVAKLTAARSDRLREARIFEEYGVWYDAFRIAAELVDENPTGAEARAYYALLLRHLSEGTTQPLRP
jgi:hypothetical protein